MLVYQCMVAKKVQKSTVAKRKNMKACKNFNNCIGKWVMDGFKFCFCLSLSLSVGVRVCGQSSTFFWSVPTVEKFVFYIVFLVWSDQIGFSLFFTAKVTNWPKNYFLTIFIFWQISSTFRYALILCTATPFIHFEESLNTGNIWWMLSWVLVVIIILYIQ